MPKEREGAVEEKGKYSSGARPGRKRVKVFSTKR